MMELKTLKDIPEVKKIKLSIDDTLNNIIIDRLLSEFQLKQEAIKWVKFMESVKENQKPTYKQFIKSFFNLTEKEMEK